MFETWAAADGTVITIRPIRAEDLRLEEEFVNGLSAPTGYQRLMSARRPSPEELKRFTDIDVEPGRGADWGQSCSRVCSSPRRARACNA